MPYENFPYTDLHNLNLDWLLKQVKEDHDYLTGIAWEPMIEAAVQEAIDDGTIGDLINQTLLQDIRDDVDALGLRVTTLEGNVLAQTRKTASATVAMLGCPAAQCTDTARGYSLCMVIHNADFCICYDMGYDDATTLLSYLASNDITKVDAFIISHYHEDHVQVASVNAICAAVDVDEWYLPHANINWGSYQGTPIYDAKEASVKAAITSGGDTYYAPTAEGESITLAGQCKVEFFNLSAAYFNNYYSYKLNEDGETTSHTNYNNFSMCCRVTIGGQMLALTGDVEQPAQQKMASMIAGANIMQIPHHGLDLVDNEIFRKSMSAQIYMTAAYGVHRSKRLETVSNLMLHMAMEKGVSVSNVGGSHILATIGNGGSWLKAGQSGKVTPSGYFGDVLRPGADLNDLVEIGREYFIQNASDASGISNIPESGAGKVYVKSTNQNSNDSTGSIMQYYEASFSYAHPKVYVRWKYEGTWTSWMQYEATSI